MKRFLILRVSAEVLPGGACARRLSYARGAVVGECETLREARAQVADLQRGQTHCHYYALDLVLMGDPARRTPIVVQRRRARRAAAAAPATRDAVVVSFEAAQAKKKGADGAP